MDFNEKAFDMIGPNAPQEVKDAWMEAAKEFLEKVLQGRIREYAEDRSFTWIGEFLKGKEKGRNNDLQVAEYKTLAETKKANQLARENAESEQELKETMIKQIAAEQLHLRFRPVAESTYGRE